MSTLGDLIYRTQPSYTAEVSPPRLRSASGTRAAILAAAQTRFGSTGFERTTLRAVAQDAGVDAAMIIRYFGSKQALFAAAAGFKLNLPDMTEVKPEHLAEILLPHFFTVWEDNQTFIALLRASATSTEAAATMREVFASQIMPALSVVTPDNPAQRAVLFGSLMLGIALTRHVLVTPAMAAMDRVEIIAWAAPLVQQVLTGPAPPAGPSFKSP